MTFCHDPHLVSHLSPFGDIVASSGGDGKILLTSVKAGTTFGIIDFGLDRRVTCIVWATNTRLIIGNQVGEVVQAEVTRSATADSSKFTILSLVTKHDCPVKALCFDVSNYLLAISFDGEIQIWCGRLTRKCLREWILYDMVLCQHNGASWATSAMAFFLANNKSLFAATNTGFGIWVHSDKSFWWYERANLPAIKHCAVSPDSRTLAVSTRNLCILIWPLSTSGPILARQQTFKVPVPTGRDWVFEAHSPPVAFLDAKSVVTADPIGTLYVISLNGQTQHVLAVGESYFIKSIWVHDTMAQVIALGPYGNPLIIGCANNQEMKRSVLTLMQMERSLTPWPWARIQDATTPEWVGPSEYMPRGLQIVRWMVEFLNMVIEVAVRSIIHALQS